MTQAQIAEHVNIPLGTLDNWKNETHSKHKLHLLLINTTTSEVEKKTNLGKRTIGFSTYLTEIPIVTIDTIGMIFIKLLKIRVIIVPMIRISLFTIGSLKNVMKKI